MSFISDILEAQASSHLTKRLIERRGQGYLDIGREGPNLTTSMHPIFESVCRELNHHPAWFSMVVSERLTPASDVLCNAWLINVLEQAQLPDRVLRLGHPVPRGAFRLKQAFQLMERHLTKAHAPAPPIAARLLLSALKGGGLAGIFLRHIPFREFTWEETFCYHRHGQAFSLLERTGSSNEDILRCYFPADSIDMAKLFDVSPHEFLYSHVLNLRPAGECTLPELVCAP